MNTKLTAIIGDAILKSFGPMSSVPVDFLMSKLFKYFITLSVVNRGMSKITSSGMFSLQ